MKRFLNSVNKVMISFFLILYQFVFPISPILEVKALDTNVYIQSSTGNTSYINTAIAVDSNIEIDLHGQANVTGAKVQITSGFVAGDVLGISGETPSISGTIYTFNSGTYNSSTGILSFSGTYNVSDLQTIFRAVTFTPASGSEDVSSRTITFTLGTGLYNTDNGHYYEVISVPAGINWYNAKTAAASKTLFGLHGYLVTITSANENNFIYSKISADSWIGASDNLAAANANDLNSFLAAGLTGVANDTEGTWTWVTGPDAGTSLSTYSNWFTNEPNNFLHSGYNGEHFGQFYFNNNGTWNDIIGAATLTSYIVEYGGMTGDTSPIITASKTVEIASHTLTYNANGGSGTVPSSVSYREAAGAQSITLASNTLTRTGYTFIGWNSASDGSGTLYQEGDTYSLSSDITLYAQWLKVESSNPTVSYAFGGNAVNVDPNFILDGIPLQSVSVSINNYVPGDVLHYTDTSAITASFANGTLILSSTSGTQSAANFQTAVRSITLSSTKSFESRTISYSVVIDTSETSTTKYNPANQHFYQLINLGTNTANHLTWEQAKADAATKTYLGKTGYLVTLTTAAEDTIVKTLATGLTGSMWMGFKNYESSADLNGTSYWDGDWRWADGPEEGTAFYTGFGNTTNCSTAIGAVVNNQYTRWASGEPNGCLSSKPTAYGTYWMDGDNTDGTKGAWDDNTNGLALQYYFIEYGGLADDLFTTTSTVSMSGVLNDLNIEQTSSTENTSTLTFSELDSTYTSLKYALIPHGQSAPTTSEIIAGQYASGGSFKASGTLTTSGTSSSSTLSGLASHFLYDIYAVQVDGNGYARNTNSNEGVLWASTIRVAYDFNNNISDVTSQERDLIPYDKYTNTSALGYTTDTSGVIQNAYQFDGTRVFTLPNDIIQDGTNLRNPFTVSFYFKTTSTLGVGLLGYANQPVYYTGAVNGYIPILSIDTNGKLHSILWKGSGDLHVVSDYAVNDGEWHKVTLSAYATPTNTSTDTLDVYLDGVQIATDSNGTMSHFNMAYVSLGTSYAAQRFDGGTYNYDTSTNIVNNWFKPYVGYIDELLIVDGGMSQEEIQEASTDISLSYELNGGTNPSGTQYLYSKTATSAYTLPTPTKDGYTFNGWYLSSNFTGDVQTSVAVGTSTNQIFYAKWNNNSDYLLTSTGLTSFAGTAVKVDPQIEVSTYETDLIKGARVSITTNFTSGDLLAHPNASYNSTTGILTFSGEYSATTLQQYLRDVTFTPSTSSTANRVITFSIGTNVFYNSTNAHYYEIVDHTSSITFASSKLAAESESFFGLNGYLATYSNTTESEFVASHIDGTPAYPWIGAQKIAGTWTWISGPDNQTTINYTIPWGTQEPDNNPDSVYLAHRSSTGWADVEEGNSVITGYVVEYGGTLNDPSLIYANLSQTKTVEINAYILSFNANGGSTVSNQSVSAGQNATEPSTPTKTGYSFVGWYSDTALTSPFNFSTAITANKTLYAKWSIAQNTVNFNSNGGTLVNPQTIAYGSLLTQPIDPVKTGYSFAGWYTNSLTTLAFSFTTQITSSQTLYAKWTRQTYTVSFNSNGGSTVSDASVLYLNQVTKPSNPNLDNKVFKGWYTNTSLTAPYDFDNAQITGNITLYAKWADIFTFDFNSNFGTYVEGQNIESGHSASEPDDPERTGYSFIEWKADSNLTNTYNFSNSVTSNTWVYAAWNRLSYTLSFYAEGVVNPSNQTILYGNTGTIPTEPTKANYTFVGWSQSPSSMVEWDFDLMKVYGNTTLYAIYQANDYNYVYKDNNGVTISSETVTFGNEITQPALQRLDGYRFVDWSQTFNESTQTFEMSPVFEEIPVNINGNEIIPQLNNPFDVIEFSDDELESSVSIRFDMNVVDSLDVASDDKLIFDTKALAILPSGTISTLYLDLSLFKTINSVETQITETTTPLQISFVVPLAYRNRLFELIRVHNGVAEVLDYTYVSSTHTITFETDQFSTYGLTLSSASEVRETEDSSTTNNNSSTYTYQIEDETPSINKKNTVVIKEDEEETTIVDANENNDQDIKKPTSDDQDEIIEDIPMTIFDKIQAWFDKFTYVVLGIQKGDDPTKVALKIIFLFLAIFALIGSWFFIIFKRRKKKEDEEKQ